MNIKLSNPWTGKPLAKKRNPRRGRQRATLKDSLFTKLQAAGKEALTVKEPPNSLKANPASVSLRIYTIQRRINTAL